MSTPSIFPRKGIGIGPGGRGNPAGDRDGLSLCTSLMASKTAARASKATIMGEI